MKNILSSLVVVVSLAVSGHALAGAGHSHSHAVAEPVSKDQVTQRAAGVIQQLVNSEKIASTWANASSGEAEKKSTSAGELWVVQFANPDATDQDKANVFVFVDEYGNAVGANHTGEL